MANRPRNNILHNIRVTLYLASILTILALLVLVSCGSGEDSILRVERERAYQQACMEFGYPEYWRNIDTKIVFCMRRSECTDDIVKLSDLRES
jgi:hypothetical protein